MSSNSSKDLQQEAVGKGLAHQLQKRHSSGEHVSVSIDVYYYCIILIGIIAVNMHVIGLLLLLNINEL